MNKYYDREGRLIFLEEWLSLTASRSYCILRRTKLSEDSYLSTVWIGIDHGALGGDYPPFIFETMVLGGPNDGLTARYRTEKEAFDGHDVIFRELMRLG